jgi:hypothetical protein
VSAEQPGLWDSHQRSFYTSEQQSHISFFGVRSILAAPTVCVRRNVTGLACEGSWLCRQCRIQLSTSISWPPSLVPQQGSFVIHRNFWVGLDITSAVATSATFEMSSADGSQQSTRRVNGGLTSSSSSSASRQTRDMHRPARIPAVQADEAAHARSVNSSTSGQDIDMDGPGQREGGPGSSASRRAADLRLSVRTGSSETRNDGE